MGWGGRIGWGVGGRFKTEGICIPMDDSCCYMAEGNTI